MYVANPENVPHFGKNNRITPPLQPVKALLRKAEGYRPPNWDCSNSFTDLPNVNRVVSATALASLGKVAR